MYSRARPTVNDIQTSLQASLRTVISNKNPSAPPEMIFAESERLYSQLANDVIHLFTSFTQFLEDHRFNDGVISPKNAWIFCVYMMLRRLEYAEAGMAHRARGKKPARKYTSDQGEKNLQINVINLIMLRGKEPLQTNFQKLLIQHNISFQ